MCLCGHPPHLKTNYYHRCYHHYYLLLNLHHPYLLETQRTATHPDLDLIQLPHTSAATLSLLIFHIFAWVRSASLFTFCLPCNDVALKKTQTNQKKKNPKQPLKFQVLVLQGKAAKLDALQKQGNQG